MRIRLAIVVVLIPPVLAGQTSGLSPDVLFLSKALRHIREGILSIPNYTCVETIDREQLKPPSRTFKRQDLVRLEVAKEGTRELFAWPGARKFEDRPVTDFVGGGLIGNGAFGLFADDLFVNGVASMKVKGSEQLDGKILVRVDFSVHSLSAPLTLATATGSAQVYYSGSWWVDPESLDLVRLDLSADDIPPILELARARIRIEYGPANGAVLPSRAFIEFAKASGEISRDEIEFARCRKFSGEAELIFDPGDVPAEVTSPGQTAKPPGALILPGGLSIPLRLKTAIDARTASVGDPVTAIIERDVKDRQRLWLPKGSRVQGRVRRLASGDGYRLVGLDFSEASVGPDLYRFFAQLESVQAVPGIENSHQRTELSQSNLPGGIQQTTVVRNFDYELPGTGYFYLTAAPFRLPEDLRMTWKTQTLRQSDAAPH